MLSVYFFSSFGKIVRKVFEIKLTRILIFIVFAYLGVINLFWIGFVKDFFTPYPPIHQGLLVVEGWVPAKSLHIAAELFKKGTYDRIVVSGGPIEVEYCNLDYKTYAERSAAELKGLGIADSQLIVASAPASAQERTYRSAVSVRQALEKAGYEVHAFDLLSSGLHARRSRYLYQIAFGENVQIGVIATPSVSYDATHWWQSSNGVKEFIAESVAYVWTLCCFDPGKKGSWEEQWGAKS